MGGVFRGLYYAGVYSAIKVAAQAEHKSPHRQESACMCNMRRQPCRRTAAQVATQVGASRRNTLTTLQHIATHSARHHTSKRKSPQHTATHCNTQRKSPHMSASQHKQESESTLALSIVSEGARGHVAATHCKTLQFTAAHYNTLQHTATHCKIQRARAHAVTFEIHL